MAAQAVIPTLKAGRISAAAIAIVLEAATCLPSMAAASQVAAPLDGAGTVHVRGLDHRAATLLDGGRNRSATFRRLCDTLEQSDVIVLVKTGSLKTPAQTMFVTASPGARFVRITLGLPEMDDVLIAWLAHELQHAVEIASAPEVISGAAMFDFFCRYGQLIPSRGPCTREAQRVRNVVAYELMEGLE